MQHYKVINSKGREVKPGTRINSFRNEQYVFLDCHHPRKIIAAPIESTIPEYHARDFYPSVFDLTITEEVY